MMKITETTPPISITSWYLDLDGAPEMEFKDGTFCPTSVTVTRSLIGENENFFFSFGTKESRHYARFSSTGEEVLIFDHLPLETINAIYKECR